MKLKLLLLLTFIVFFMAQAYAQVTAIKAGKLVDPAMSSIQSNVIILVDGTKITAVGTDVTIPRGANVIDLSNMVVLPGLIDGHTHLCNAFDTKRDVGPALLLYTLTVSTTDRAFHGAASARSVLESGFTTVRDMGNAGNYADASLKHAIDQGIVPGPTVLISGKIIAPFGGQFILDPELPDLGRHDYIYADTRDEIRQGIRQNIHFGADWIKIIIDDYDYIYSAEDVGFIVDEAAKAGKKVAAHCVTEQGARNAINGGVASIEHGFEMSDETLNLAKQKGTVLVATDFTQEIMDLYNFFSHSYQDIVDRLKRAYRIGVPLVYGSDIIADVPGHTRGSASLTTIDTWADAGIPPGDILRGLTTNAAELLGIENERGAIKSGMAADIIAAEKNPLDNITALKQVMFVMKDGSVFKHIR
ncbi:amidohydrolase family protein [candidate division KSB1 bacterium]